MPYDAVNLSALIDEMSALKNQKVEKIYALDLHTFELLMRGKVRIIICAAANYPAFFIHDGSTNRIPEPPAFLSALKKHLNNAILKNISAQNCERVVELEFLSRDDLGYEKTIFLIAEIMGRYSNIFLLDDRKRILAMHKTASLDLGAKRVNLTGCEYAPVPQQDKPSIDDEQAVARLLAGNEGASIEDCLKKGVKGISPMLIRELIYRFNEQDLAHGLATQYRQIVSNPLPTLIFKDGAPHDFCLTELKHLDMAQENAVSLNNAAASVFFYRLDAGSTEAQKRIILSPLRELLKKRHKRLRELQESIKKSQDFEHWRIVGDLLISNAHLVPRGSESVVVDNFYEEQCPKIEIELDSQLNAAQNAQAFYKRYAKSKQAYDASYAMLDKIEADIAYLVEAIGIVEDVNEVAELDEIKLELENEGYLRGKQRIKGKKSQAVSTPYRYEIEGFVILAGKNNIQNDKLVKSSNGNDLWMHASGINGSHVVLHGNNPPQHIILKAAALAAYHSKARAADNVPVDITFVKNVRKIAGAPPGKVTFVNQKTVFVEPQNF